MRSLALYAALALLAGCGTEQFHDQLPDGGAIPPRYDELDLDSANLVLTVASDDQTVFATLALHSSDGRPVTLQDQQSVSVNGSALAQTDAGLYSIRAASSSSYAVKVDEPRHGVLTTAYTPPAAFSISSTTFNLAGTTLTWTPTDVAAGVSIHIEQQNPNGHPTIDASLASDTGSKSFTDLDLKQFVQGYPVGVTVTKTYAGAALQGTASSTVTVARERSWSVNPTSGP